MRVDILALVEKNLYEGIFQPTDEEQKNWNKTNEGKLYYVIRGKDNQVIEYIDTARVDTYNKENGKNSKPKTVAEHLFKNRGILIEEEYVAEPSSAKIGSVTEVDVESGGSANTDNI